MPKRNDPSTITRRPLLGKGERLGTPTSLAHFTPDGEPRFTSAEVFQQLSPLAALMEQRLTELSPATTVEHVVFEATVRPNYLAPSHLPVGLLDAAEAYVVGTRPAVGTHRSQDGTEKPEVTKRLILAAQRGSVAKLAARLQEAPTISNEKFWEDATKFESIRIQGPEEVLKLTPGQPLSGNMWEAVLAPLGRDPDEREELAAAVLAKLRSLVVAEGGRFVDDLVRTVAGNLFVPIAGSLDAIRRIAHFNPLRAVRPMPSLRPVKTPLRSISLAPAVSSLAPVPRTDLRVAIFDGGINDRHPFFKAYVKQTSLTPEPPTDDFQDHGTAVTSTYLFGEISGSRFRAPPSYVDHYRVLPTPDREDEIDGSLYWILDRIQDQVEKSQPRIAVLSLGPDQSVAEDDFEPNRWTATLDDLAERVGTLFFVAVGNNGKDPAELGLNRVLVPGDGVNVIGVGSDLDRVARKWPRRAPHSPIGPGRPGQPVQPVGVAWGGTEADGLLTFDRLCRVVRTCGTSFAAPNAAAGVAELIFQLGEHGTTQTARAMSVHLMQAKSPSTRLRETGYGRFPERYDHVWDSPPNQATVLYELEVERGQTIAVELPFPESLPGDTRLALDWTIAFQSEIDSGDVVEYTTRGLDLKFRPNSALFNILNKEHAVVGTHDIRNGLDAAALRAKGQRLSEHPIADSSWRRRKGQSEVDLRRSHKWQTLITGRTCYARAELFCPRLDIHMLARAKGELVSDVPSLRVAMIATLSATTNVDVYASVRKNPRYRALVPVIPVPIHISATG